MKNYFEKAIFILITMLLCNYEIDGQILKPENAKPYIIQRINSPITLDGLSNEAAWENIEPLPVVQHKPIFGNVPTERTEILIAYDHEYLYVAGRLYDSEPHKITSSSKKRDSNNPNSQWFGIAMDTYNDNENALAFFTTPSGLRWDATILNDTRGTITMNTSWNTFWDVEVVQNNEGWFAEFKIPFSSLRFQDADGKVEMGLISWRSIARKSEFIIFPAIPPNWGGESFYKLSEAWDVVFNKLFSHTPIYVAPYLLSGFDRSAMLNEKGNTYINQNDTEFNPGLDLKYGITNNLTLDVTVNPDFAQVEADDQQVNLERFSLFYPEKRMFFQERSSNFEFNFEDNDRLFHSRSIGIHDGKPVRIYGGARISGRVGPWDVGFLNMQTEKIDDISSQNHNVLRLRKQVINPYSYLGGIAVTKIGTNGLYNATYGLDGTFRLFANDYLTAKWAQTFDSDVSNKFLSLTPSRAYLDWERRLRKGLSYKIRITRSGADYNPEMGYQERQNYTYLFNRFIYSWQPGKNSRLFEHMFYSHYHIFVNNEEHKIETAKFFMGWNMETKSGYMFDITPAILYEDIPETFQISKDAEVEHGKYYFGRLYTAFSTPTGGLMRLHTNMIAGSFYDGWRFSWQFQPRLDVSSSVEIKGSYQYIHVNFADRNQIFNSHLSKLQILYMLNTKFSISSIVQYNNEIDAVILNARLRYNPREGVDLYLVYNETFNTERNAVIPVLPFSKSRAILLKFTYTFNI